MRNWRVLTAIAAVVLAALAVVLVLKYTDDAKHDAAKPFTKVTVLVAKSHVAANTSFERALSTQLIEREDRVRDGLPDEHIDGRLNDDDLKKAYGKQIASHDLAAGQTLLDTDFADTGSIPSGLAGTLSTDEDKLGKNKATAIAVNLDDTHAVGGFLQPGDRVNVIASMDIVDPTDESGKPVSTTAFLIPGVKVLAVGSTTFGAQASSANGTTPTAANTTPQNRNVITLEVTARQALQITTASKNGQLNLTLNPSTYNPGDFKVDSVDEIAGASNVFDQTLTRTDQMLAAIKAAHANK